jgi:hypothetical protein
MTNRRRCASALSAASPQVASRVYDLDLANGVDNKACVFKTG